MSCTHIVVVIAVIIAASFSSRYITVEKISVFLSRQSQKCCGLFLYIHILYTYIIYIYYIRILYTYIISIYYIHFHTCYIYYIHMIYKYKFKKIKLKNIKYTFYKNKIKMNHTLFRPFRQGHGFVAQRFVLAGRRTRLAALAFGTIRPLSIY